MKAYKSKIKYIFLSTLLVVFTGCSQSAFKYFDKEEEFVHNAQYTKVLKIVDKDIVKAMANVTYLNGADSKSWNNGKENFIIGQYLIDKKDTTYSLDLVIQKKKKVQLDETNIEYETTIFKPISEKVIEKSDPIYNHIPFRNSWAEYKLVSFEDIKAGENFTFIFKDNKGNSKKTTFTAE